MYVVVSAFVPIANRAICDLRKKSAGNKAINTERASTPVNRLTSPRPPGYRRRYLEKTASRLGLFAIKKSAPMPPKHHA